MLGNFSRLVIRYSPSPHVSAVIARYNLVEFPEGAQEIVGKRGVRWVVDCKEYVMRTLYLHGEYESNTMRHLHKLFLKIDEIQFYFFIKSPFDFMRYRINAKFARNAYYPGKTMTTGDAEVWLG